MNHHYNPDWLNDDDLLAGFIARQSEFNFLRDELARAPREGSVQHYLLIGQRGAGKTTLLKRLAIAIRRDAELSDHLIALSFPEELYQVKNLTDFWWATCEALADELDRQGNKALADQLFDAVDRSRSPRAESSEDSGLQTLLKTAASIQRRPVLLVDNLDMVFERIDKKGRKLKDPLSPAYWALREALSTTTSPIVIGGSVRLSEPFTDYDKAFYDFFLPKRLGKLALSEVRQVLEHLAERENSPEVKTRLHQRPGRIDALYELTGGNPRAIGFIFQLLRQGPNRRAVEDFEQLMDLTTPYYKARFEDLSEQAQVVMHALATRRNTDGSALRFGHTAAEIANHAGLPTNTISAQMDVLEREGLVEKSAGQGRTQYRIAEQLFRLWLQMRASRRIRQNVIGLAEFLEAMYNLDEMTAELQRNGHGLNAARLAFAVADTRSAAPLRRGLEAYGSDCLNHAPDEGKHGCHERLPNTDLPTEVATLRELKQQLVEHPEHGLSEAEQDALLGSLELRLSHKKEAIRALSDRYQHKVEVEKLRVHFANERLLLAEHGLNTEDQNRIFQLRAKGLLPLPDLTTGDADAVLLTHQIPEIEGTLWRLVGTSAYVKFTSSTAKAWLYWGQQHVPNATTREWENFAKGMRLAKQLDIARAALSIADSKGNTVLPWKERARLAQAQNNIPDAEYAYRKALESNPEDLFAWHELAELFANTPGKEAEAECIYNEAISTKPTEASLRNNLGNLLAKNTERHFDAELSYKKAIELDPKLSTAYFNYGMLIAEIPNRQAESVLALKKAIELNPKFEEAKRALGVALLRQGQYEEASLLLEDDLTDDQLINGINEFFEKISADRAFLERLSLAIRSNSADDIKNAFIAFFGELTNAANTISSQDFFDKVLLPALNDEKKSQEFMKLFRGSHFEVYARPMFLALEAALTKQPQALENLEPEVRGAAIKQYERIQAALAAQNNSGGAD